MESADTGHRPRRRRGRRSPLLRAGAHCHVRCGQRHRAGIRVVPRPPARLRQRVAGGGGGAGGPRRARGAQPGVHRGLRRGARVAKEILAWRQNDGWVVATQPAYVQPPLPGRWQPTPPNNPVAVFTHLQYAAPLALATSTHFLPPPPPLLTSDRYAADVAEVQMLGKNDST